MQKIGSCGGEHFAPAALINPERPEVEEEVGAKSFKIFAPSDKLCSICVSFGVNRKISAAPF